MNNNSFRVAFCGLITAFALALMFATGLIPVGTYAFPCFAGMLLVAVVIEFGARWALAAFAAVSLLSFFLSGDKEAVVYFIAFFGFYPILKSAIERLKSKVLQYVIKYAVFTACIVAAFFVCMSMMCNAILQAAGKERLPIISILIGGAVKIGVNWVLVGCIYLLRR